jgi:choline monooxygenase
MSIPLKEIIDSYDPEAPLEEASTIPASWYVREEVYEAERRTVFSNSWQVVGGVNQVREPGEFITREVAGEPILVIRGEDCTLRGFYNVCRHHAAAVITPEEGKAKNLRCPYHGWTYSLEGDLRGTPDIGGICNFDRSKMGLMPVETAVWDNWVFVRLGPSGPSLKSYVGQDLVEQLERLSLDKLHWVARRSYELKCNWKVFVDNYLDGGYHVPHLHKGLDSVLDYSEYSIATGARFCLQSSPMTAAGAESQTGAVRQGDRALYYWIYPNFMINWYEGMMDTNLVRPLGVDRTQVIFDFYFSDDSVAARQHNMASIEVSDRIQNEDLAICESVQRGLNSRAYNAGRLSVRREAGEHLFHKLLYHDLKAGCGDRAKIRSGS